MSRNRFKGSGSSDRVHEAPLGFRAVVVLTAVLVSFATGELLHWALVFLLIWVGRVVCTTIANRGRGG